METMKKTTALLALLLAFFFPALAQQQGDNQGKQVENKQQTVTPRGNFVDQNNNGLCDHFESGTRPGKGANFTDKNGDGICDHRQGQKGQGNQCMGNGNGRRQHGNAGCCGRGQGFRHQQGGDETIKPREK